MSQNHKLSWLYHNMNNVVQLRHVAYISSAYYSTHSRVYVLKDCHREIQTPLIIGYSEALEQYVTIEREAVRPLVTSGNIHDFVYADDQFYNKCLIITDTKSEDFKSRFKFTFRYIAKCYEADFGRALAWRSPILRQNMREIIDHKKVVISTLGNICSSMLDAEANIVPTIGSYMCTFPGEDFSMYKAYMSIFNSRVFSYLFYYELANRVETNLERIEVLGRICVPMKTEAYYILENIAECFMYLNKPNLPQLTSRITNDRLVYYLNNILDMVVYEMYFPDYMRRRGLDVIREIFSAPFMKTYISIEDRILSTYTWFQSPNNIVRQKMDLLDTRSPELLYVIHTFVPNE